MAKNVMIIPPAMDMISNTICVCVYKEDVQSGYTVISHILIFVVCKVQREKGTENRYTLRVRVRFRKQSGQRVQTQ